MTDRKNSDSILKEYINPIEEYLTRDTEALRTSSLLTDMFSDEEAASNRNHKREEILSNLDQMIADKVQSTSINLGENFDQMLDQISLDRKQAREQLVEVHRPTKRQKEKAREQHKEEKEEVAIAFADTRLDTLVDKVLVRTKQVLFSSMVRLSSSLKTVKKGFVKASSILTTKMQPITKPIRIKGNQLFLNIKEKETLFSSRIANRVIMVDSFVDRSIERIISYEKAGINKWNQGRNWAEANKKKLVVAFLTTTAATTVVAIVLGNMTAYEYLYNGKVLGIVKDQRDVYRTIEIIGDKLTLAYGAEIVIDPDEDITFQKVIGANLKIDTKDDVLNNFTYLKDMNAYGYELLVDGERIAVLDSKKTAENILQVVKNQFIVESDAVEYESIGFAEEIEIQKFNTKIGNIDPDEEALDYILTGAVEEKIHVVQSGETFNQIAKDYGLTAKELQACNPNASPAKLHIGQELTLNQICPLVTVQTTEIATYKEAIEYDITYEETSTLYKGEQTVKSRGIAGQQEVVAEIVRNNGMEISRNVLTATVLSEPVSQVVLKGTKALPPLIGTGTFIYPTRGTLTSRFGPRWGRMHYGIDLAAPVGTKIRASDGGKVIYAGRDGALGLVVRIDHGGNRVTVYGHCSKILVKVGDKVYQDQHIANVGNTGYSTGPHLHFEVRINGVAQNPLKYLN